MRPRFSLKWLLILFAIVAWSLYLCFVRPSVLADKFVTLVRNNEYSAAESLCIAESRPFTEYVNTESVVVTVELFPRTRDDFWKMRRRMWIRVIPVTDGGGENRFRGSADFSALSGPLGVRLDGE